MTEQEEYRNLKTLNDILDRILQYPRYTGFSVPMPIVETKPDLFEYKQPKED